eukprot:CAMPEP_0117020486 /NCGR_PEP_ID=MMETSP0472-20121206/15573_1 /TAXON_ID=693140 ORGANISM="Tiarina fusus, Strain LIS" /NCGR_SAMPLE_ID=MMETSP0472 /ASSEMBLY_ACC=CAM_ASM_000603 /LENGTH=188 /DNA_ID=CAMNT_0004725717 /DNA_START=103 /DNA_END=669 /DNA_ORIENTATION=-
MMLCIGGVCVPYTAVVPICILCFKWLIGKLAQMGLLPKAVQDLLQVYGPSPATTTEEKSACCAAPAGAGAEGGGGPSLVKALESDEDFQSFLKESDKVICKFTATWCKPCHKIQPFYEQCSSKYADQKETTTTYTFLTIDVDDYDEIATTYNVAMMPTFLVLKGESVLGKYAGSNEHELQRFLKEHLD